MTHGSERYFVRGEGLILGRLFPLGLLRWIFRFFYDPPRERVEDSYAGPDGCGDDIDDDPDAPVFEFCRLFPKGPQPDPSKLTRLGLLIEEESADPGPENDSRTPAGYTYLGQFVDHDITFDAETPLASTAAVEPADIENFRSPHLDLDSVYGGGPDGRPDLYEADRKTLRVGETSAIDGIPALPKDLPRLGADAGPGEKPTQAVIADPRNDENLAVAQIHLAFIELHNARVAADPAATFEEIRESVVLDYQAIVLADFLPRVIEPGILQDVLDNGRKFYVDEHEDCMPVEFSVAAYRMGHSMVRPTYEWNRIFNSEGPRGIATLAQLFEFSGVSGRRGDPADDPFEGFPTLPSNWVADWRRLFELVDADGRLHPQLNRARKLDARMALDLKTLPEFQQLESPPPAPLLSLATRNLLRGRLVSLPTGQAVATAMGLTPLTESDVVSTAPDGQQGVLLDGGFGTATPLWYYVLREATVIHKGERLGPVGSRILAETFVGLIENTETSVLLQDPQRAFSMPQLILEVGEPNPIGDA